MAKISAGKVAARGTAAEQAAATAAAAAVAAAASRPRRPSKAAKKPELSTLSHSTTDEFSDKRACKKAGASGALGNRESGPDVLLTTHAVAALGGVEIAPEDVDGGCPAATPSAVAPAVAADSVKRKPGRPPGSNSSNLRSPKAFTLSHVDKGRLADAIGTLGRDDLHHVLHLAADEFVFTAESGERVQLTIDLDILSQGTLRAVHTFVDGRGLMKIQA